MGPSTTPAGVPSSPWKSRNPSPEWQVAQEALISPSSSQWLKACEAALAWAERNQSAIAWSLPISISAGVKGPDCGSAKGMTASSPVSVSVVWPKTAPPTIMAASQTAMTNPRASNPDGKRWDEIDMTDPRFVHKTFTRPESLSRMGDANQSTLPRLDVNQFPCILSLLPCAQDVSGRAAGTRSSPWSGNRVGTGWQLQYPVPG